MRLSKFNISFNSKPKCEHFFDSTLSNELARALKDKAEEIIFETSSETGAVDIFHKIDGAKHLTGGLPPTLVDKICATLKKRAKTYNRETREGRVEVRLSDSTGYFEFVYDFDFTLHPTPTRLEGDPHIVFDRESFEGTDMAKMNQIKKSWKLEVETWRRR